MAENSHFICKVPALWCVFSRMWIIFVTVTDSQLVKFAFIRFITMFELISDLHKPWQRLLSGDCQ